MKNLYLLIAVTALFILYGCQKDDPTVQDELMVQAGTTENSSHTSNLLKPDTVFNNTFHNTIRSLDLDGDLDCEFCLVSSEAIINSTTVVRELKIIPGASREENISVLTLNPNPPYMAMPYSVGTTIAINNEFCYYLSEELVLARYTYDLLSGVETFEGNWNGKSNKCLILKYEKDASTYVTWIELSVTQYDNYVFHNFATFRKD